MEAPTGRSLSSCCPPRAAGRHGSKPRHVSSSMAVSGRACRTRTCPMDGPAYSPDGWWAQIDDAAEILRYARLFGSMPVRRVGPTTPQHRMTASTSDRDVCYGSRPCARFGCRCRGCRERGRVAAGGRRRGRFRPRLSPAHPPRSTISSCLRTNRCRRTLAAGVRCWEERDLPTEVPGPAPPIAIYDVRQRRAGSLAALETRCGREGRRGVHGVRSLYRSRRRSRGGSGSQPYDGGEWRGVPTRPGRQLDGNRSSDRELEGRSSEGR